MWVTKLLISPVKKDFLPKKVQILPENGIFAILAQALQAHLACGCGARAVSRKTPIYFIISHSVRPICRYRAAKAAKNGNGGCT